MRPNDPGLQVHISIKPSTVISVDASYPHPDLPDVFIPWYVWFGDYKTAAVRVRDRETLIALRDALTAALDEHPDAS